MIGHSRDKKYCVLSFYPFSFYFPLFAMIYAVHQEQVYKCGKLAWNATLEICKKYFFSGLSFKGRRYDRD